MGSGGFVLPRTSGASVVEQEPGNEACGADADAGDAHEGPASGVVESRSRRAASRSADEDQDQEHGVHAAPGLGADGEDACLVGAHPALDACAEQNYGDDYSREHCPAEQESDGRADGDEQAWAHDEYRATTIYEPPDEGCASGAGDAEQPEEASRACGETVGAGGEH